MLLDRKAVYWELIVALREALIARFGNPYRKHTHIAREIGCDRTTIAHLFKETHPQAPTHSIHRFIEALNVGPDIAIRWTTAARIWDWSNTLRSSKTFSRRRLEETASQDDLPLWSRWMAQRLCELDWSITDLSRAIGHRNALLKRAKGGSPNRNLVLILRGDSVPRALAKIEKVLGKAPEEVRRAIRIASHAKQARATRKTNSAVRKARGRWYKQRLFEEIKKLLGEIPESLRRLLTQLPWDKRVGVEGARIYLLATAENARRKGGGFKGHMNKPKEQTARLMLSRYLTTIRHGNYDLSQCPGCFEIQIRGLSVASAQGRKRKVADESRCRPCWMEFVGSEPNRQWCVEREAAKRSGSPMPSRPAMSKRSGRRMTAEKIRESLEIYLRHALDQLLPGEREEHKDSLEQIARLLEQTRNAKGRTIFAFSEELLIPRLS